MCGNYATATALVDELVALADEKGSLYWKAAGMIERGELFALTGKASDAVRMIASGIAAFRSAGQHAVFAVCTYHIWREPMRNSANSMTLGAALARR